jgi:UDP-N-acetylglucosamine acyltransferase
MGFVHPSVQIGVGALIGPDVIIEDGCSIGAYSIIEGQTHIGPDNRIFPHVILGGEPQDHKFIGGGKLTIGRGNVFREFVTVHVGHLTDGGTVIGDGNMLLTSAHLGHDCIVGDRNFIANNTMMAGHVEIMNDVNLSGHVGSHQFCRIGSHAMVSGMSAIRQDVLPYSIVQGDPARMIGINKVGLQRKGWSKEQIFSLQDAFRHFRNGESLECNEYWSELKAFKESSDRGLMKIGKKK